MFCVTAAKTIYKTRNTGTGNGMRGMRGTRGLFTRIPGECYYFNIPGNVPEDSGECSKRFWGMFEEILGNVQEDSGGCTRKFWGIFERIPGNVQEDSGDAQEDFGESKFRFVL